MLYPRPVLLAYNFDSPSDEDWAYLEALYQKMQSDWAASLKARFGVKAVCVKWRATGALPMSRLPTTS